MSDVYFFDYSRGGSVLQGLKSLFHEANLTGVIPVDGSVAVKLHMGELGNITYLRPILVRRVVDLLRRAGGKPFVTDTTALYPGGRDTPQKYLATAATNGFVEQSVNAPIIIADGGDDLGVPVAVDGVEGCELTEVRVASRIYHADSLIVLTHFKGHMQTGFGGALKNMGMGCVVKETKKAQHRVNTPLLDESLCDGCGICIESCPRGALWLEDDKPRRDLDKCGGCSTCVFECPSHAFYFGEGMKEQLQVNIAHASWAVLQKFSGRSGFINFVQDVTPHCDCASPSGMPLVQDVGVLASLDPVAIDKASLDMVDKAALIGSSLIADQPDRLGKLHGTDSLVQLKTAQKLGLGSLEYRLIPVG